MRMPITRPRMSGSEASCMKLLEAVVKATAASARGDRQHGFSKTHSLGCRRRSQAKAQAEDETAHHQKRYARPRQARDHHRAGDRALQP